MTTGWKVLSLGIVLMAVASCQPTPDADRPAAQAPATPIAGLEGTAWVAESIFGESVAKGVESTISFLAKAEVHGNGGCNEYFGAWTTEGDAIAFGHLGATMMMCPEEQMEQEDSFMDALGTAERFEIKGGKLYIFSTGGDHPMVLRPHVPEQAGPGED